MSAWHSCRAPGVSRRDRSDDKPYTPGAGAVARTTAWRRIRPRS
jgi:hypothetical protein